MNSLIIAAVVFVVALSGCASIPTSMPTELRALLAPEFSMPRRSKISEEEVYRILEAFAPHRNPKEFVSSIDLYSPDSVDLVLTPSGPHGNSSAKLKKKDGRWVYEITMGPL